MYISTKIYDREARLQNSPYFAYSSTREQSNKRYGTARFTDFFTDFEKKKKKATVLQSIGKLTWLHGRESSWVVRTESGLNENVLDTNNIET